MFILSAALVLSSSLFSPFLDHVHTHKSANPTDRRITFNLRNESHFFHDVKIDGHSYTIQPNEGLVIKAPVGTIINANSRFGTFRPGDTLLIVNASLQSSRFEMR